MSGIVCPLSIGRFNLEDKAETARLSDFDDQALLAAVELDEQVTTRMLAKDFNIDQLTIVD